MSADSVLITTSTTPAMRGESALRRRAGVLGMAALAMVATLPGRTQGLGLITEALMKSLSVDRVTYAELNFWATVIGAAFCLRAGG